MSASLHSCLSDRPLKGDKASSGEDYLDISKYVNGLSNFLLQADTPVTIGIQGGWGSGKTSFINILREKLAENKEDKTLSVFVNAWEHSLLQGNDDKSSVAISLLRALVDGIKDSLPDDERKNLEGNGIFTKITNTFAAVAYFGAKVVLKNAADFELVDPETSAQSPQVPLAKIIRELKQDLVELVKKLKEAPYNKKRIVFFIDDLDRIHPAIAVEILDITKNIFDLEDCIFVIAIDYDVIVKGLEGKFGKKTEENEREFRQYFDKIIQIPFSMPIGAYEKKLKELLKKSFEKIGNPVEDSRLKNMSDVALAATDGIPRSIKRIINTCSLLSNISDSTDATITRQQTAAAFEVRFIIVALLINFPEIYYKIISEPDFVRWNLDNVKEKWELTTSIPAPDQLARNDQYFDEEWEKVLYCLCQKNTWLQGKASAVSRICNALYKALARTDKHDDLDADSKEKSRTKNVTEKIFKPEELAFFGTILETVKVVSVETSEESFMRVDNSSVKTDSITCYCKELHRLMLSRIPGLKDTVDTTHAMRSSGTRIYSIRHEDPSQVVGDIVLESDSEHFYFVLEPRRGNQMNRALKELFSFNTEGKYETYGRRLLIKYDNFDDKSCFDYRKASEHIDEMVSFYNAIKTQLQSV